MKRNNTTAARAAAGVMIGAAAVLVLPLGGCNQNKSSVAGMDSVAKEQSIRDAQEHAEFAQQLVKQKRYDEAIDQYRRAIESYDRFGGAWNNLGELLAAKNMGREAAEAYRMAAELLPSDPRPMKNLGDLWQKQSYLDEAAERYTLALDRDPNYLPALREATRVDHARDFRSEVTADRIKRALMLETDPVWRVYFIRQKQLVDQRLAAANETPAR